MIVYNSPDDPSKFNRGFAFLDYDSHKSASAARRTIVSTRLQVWGSEVIVEWAEPQEEPDAETMSKVCVQASHLARLVLVRHIPSPPPPNLHLASSEQ